MGANCSPCSAREDQESEQREADKASAPGGFELNTVEAQDVKLEPLNSKHAACSGDLRKPGVDAYRDNGGDQAQSEFYIEVQKHLGLGLGVDVDFKDGTELVIDGIRPGLIQDWNAANPNAQVFTEDAIVEVNG